MLRPLAAGYDATDWDTRRETFRYYDTPAASSVKTRAAITSIRVEVALPLGLENSGLPVTLSDLRNVGSEAER